MCFSAFECGELYFCFLNVLQKSAICNTSPTLYQTTVSFIMNDSNQESVDIPTSLSGELVHLNPKGESSCVLLYL